MEACFLFDLDGTLVQTDEIYMEVWKIILSEYKIEVDMNFFKTFIRGKSDKEFLGYMIPSMSAEELKLVSKRKDKIFSEMIEECSLLFDDVIPFMEKIKNRKIGVVTSSNRDSAQKILEITNLSEYVSFLVASEDCMKHKPDPEPYRMAMNYFGFPPEKSFIFEDTLSGLKSGIATGCENVYIRQSDETPGHKNIFKSLEEINLEISVPEKKHCPITEIFIDQPFQKIFKHENCLKTGYICDIERYSIEYRDGKKMDVIHKVSNMKNTLSDTAEKIDLYRKEILFYQKFSKMVNIKIPKFYGITSEDGIVMEDLTRLVGSFNMDLNLNMDILLRVVKDISGLHNRFIFKSDEDLFPSAKFLDKPSDIDFYRTLILERKKTFLGNCSVLLSSEELTLMKRVIQDFDVNVDRLSCYPLSLCHGDLKSPNIFYENFQVPYYLDWQYIHLNKGVSDIVFLLIESVEFDFSVSETVLKYYFRLSQQENYDHFMRDLKSSLGVFPLFVTVWFNTESPDKLLDKVFPISFMKRYLKYLKGYY
jgi:beta-phosphoglucomutase